MSDRSLDYCAFYCEENVWRLCHGPLVLDDAEGPEDIPVAARRAVFISARSGVVVMAGQRAGKDGVVAWDYHVVLFVRRKAGWHCLDLDTTLVPPGQTLPAAAWLEQSLVHWATPGDEPLLRVVDAAAYRRALSSDRSHMRGPSGAFERPPPSWPAPLQPGIGMNLMRFVDMDDDIAGAVARATTLHARLLRGEDP